MKVAILTNIVRMILFEASFSFGQCLDNFDIERHKGDHFLITIYEYAHSVLRLNALNTMVLSKAEQTRASSSFRPIIAAPSISIHYN